LSLLEAHVECRAKIAITDLTPAPDTEIVGVHMLAGNIAFKTRGIWIDLVLHLSDNVTELYPP
jgi:hypothetical protein